MTRRRSIGSMVAALAMVGSACSSSSAPSPGSGGSHGTGGVTSQGGAVGSGGSVQPGTGGENGTGGRTGSGSGGTSTAGQSGSGGAAVGGASGTGGRSGSGGQPGSGGMPGTGGSSASGGTTSQPGTGGRSASGGTTSQPGSGGAAGGNTGRDGGSATGGAGGGTAIDGGGGSAAVPSAGCGKTPTLKNSPTATANQNTISGSRQFLIRWPSNYDNTHPYRLILDFHGAGGSDTEEAPSYFGLFDLSNNTTIFVAPSASGGIWDATADLTLVDAILKAVEADLCIDTSRVELEGFSQGGAMVATLACSRPGVFRAAVGHSRGGLTAPTTCQPIPYLGSLGLSDVAGNSQATQTDPFAKWNGCTVTTMPLAPTGGHVCQNYTGCPAADPVIWCSFDGPHTASPTDSGKSTSWMPAEVWPFLSQY